MKLAVVTVVLGKDYREQAEITHPSLRDYAQRIGAEFIRIEDQKISKLPYFEKLRLHDVLADHDRAMFLDSDIIARYDCPSLFNVVPPDLLGMYDGGLLASSQEQEVHRSILTQAMREYYGLPLPDHWKGEFYNTGVIVASRCHRDLFKMPDKEVALPCLDQAYFDAMLLHNRIPVFDIGYRFNRMYYVDKVVKKHRLCSYIVHYAGIRNFDNMARRDLALWAMARRTPDIFLERP